MSALTDIVSGKLRKQLYAGYALLGLGLGATQVGFLAAEAGQPVWLTVSLAVFGFLGTGLGFTASSNVNPDVVPDGDGRYRADV